MSSRKPKDRKDDNHPSSGRSDPTQVIGRFVKDTPGGEDPLGPNGEGAATTSVLDRVSPASTPAAGVNGQERSSQPAIAVFCHEGAESFIGKYATGVVTALARRGRTVYLFSRHPMGINEQHVHARAVGSSEDGDLIEQVQEFNRRAVNAFNRELPSTAPVAVIGFEWTSTPVLSLLRGLRNLPSVLSLHSLERQRSDLSSDMSRRIAELEAEALQSATTLLIHDSATAEVARYWVPSTVDRVVHARMPFPMHRFESNLDPGQVKARYQVGPIDPTLLYIGDLDDRYGPDLIVKAMPAILRHHPQTRLVLVGDGHLLWPLRVYARYLLLEHAIRLVGDVRGSSLDELVQAADVIVVPSREATPWWPIQAGWAARKPVVATHEAARSLTEHEKDSVLIYPSENSVVWGVERVLYDADLRQTIGAAGRRKLEERFGWNALAEQLEEVLATTLAR